MSHPLTVQFWLWGQDAKRGDLEARGFRKTSHPQGKGSSIYRKGPLGLHASAAWLETPQDIVFYARPRDGFFLLDALPEALEPPPDARALGFDAGLRALLPKVLEHEAWIRQHHGPQDRLCLMRQLPPAVRKGWAAWERWVGSEAGSDAA
ncbi:MAG: hypothetical protein C4342_01755 [Armatimonadota bacterium]